VTRKVVDLFLLKEIHKPTITFFFQKVQPSADRAAQNLEIISKNFQFGTRRTRILMGFIISTMLLGGMNVIGWYES